MRRKYTKSPDKKLFYKRNASGKNSHKNLEHQINIKNIIQKSISKSIQKSLPKRSDHLKNISYHSFTFSLFFSSQ
jgi:hypothetical protein